MSSGHHQQQQQQEEEVVDTGNGIINNHSKRPKWIQALRALLVWYPKNIDLQERKTLFKLDWAIMVYAGLSFFCKFLDQTNVVNAYVSGMKEHLSLYGNELNYLNMIYLSGYVIGQVPFMLLITRPAFSRYVLPTLEVLYGICTFCQSRITNVHQLYALRFLVGFFEAPSFAGVHFILGKYYGAHSYRGNPPELYVRAGVFFVCSPLGTMFSGYLQSAAYKNLNGTGGLAGWQWLFIIDGIITVPVAFIGFAFWPGIPEHSKPWYLTPEDYKVVLSRSKRYAVAKAGKLDWAVWKRTFKDWKVYLFVTLYIAMLLAYYPSTYLSLWLKAQGTYTIPQVNNLPTVTSACAVLSGLFGTAFASAYAPWKAFMAWVVGMLTFSIIMTIYNVTPGLVFFGFYMSGAGACGAPILFSMINRSLAHDQEGRALVLGLTMGVAYIVYAFAPLGLFPTDVKKYGANAAPRWKTGYPTSLGLTVLVALLMLAIVYMEKRDAERKGELQNSGHKEISELSTSEDEIEEEHHITTADKKSSTSL